MIVPRAAAILALLLMAACGRPSGDGAATGAPASTDSRASAASAPTFFVGRWASDVARCSDAPWTISTQGLRTPGHVVCSFREIERTVRGAAADATCTAEGPPQEYTIQFSYAESAKALLIEDAPFNDVGLVRCPD
ncbi:MAG TPA: hypothetical protein VFV10_10560 [Gammaproteobacteria bacterium]|nr:hypothetical protein [Gammaproteobacteria bacterium]